MSVLAFDLGASSGKALIGQLKEGRLSVTEIHRFPNDPVQVGGRLHWDILRLLHEIKQGILKSKHAGYAEELQGIAIDSWAVDFGLIGANGELIANPYHYRDHHTDGIMEEVHALIGKKELFSRTGIQFLPFNTINQLYAMGKAASPQLKQAETLLMIPDLLRYFLTGIRKGEFTNATTTQLYNPTTGVWDEELLGKLGIERSLFPEIVRPGTVIGKLSQGVCEELGVGPVPVIATAEHDTGAAVAAVPADSRDFAYLSCGTWSLLGTEIGKPVLDDQALTLNFTNEGGVEDTFRLLKNIMGLWIVQECQRTWEKEGQSLTFPELVALAEKAPPFTALIDPDAPMFLNPAHMPGEVQRFCRETVQQVPGTPGEITRCVLESLALKYRYVLERTEQLSGKSFRGLNMVGGGIHNKLLCRFTASAIGRPVWAGPAEGSGIGNILVQLIALGEISGIAEARAIVRRSFPPEAYLPEEPEVWNEAYTRFLQLL